MLVLVGFAGVGLRQLCDFQCASGPGILRLAHLLTPNLLGLESLFLEFEAVIIILYLRDFIVIFLL